MNRILLVCYVLVIGIAIPVLLDTILDFRVQQEENESFGALHQVVQAMRRGIPRQVNEVTWLERVAVEGANIVFDLRFLLKFNDQTHKSPIPGIGQIDFEAMRQSVRLEFENLWCSNPVVVEYILKPGGGFKYRYIPSTNENHLVYSFTIHDCPGIGVPAIDYSIL